MFKALCGSNVHKFKYKVKRGFMFTRCSNTQKRIRFNCIFEKVRRSISVKPTQPKRNTIDQEFQCESGCWRESWKEILITRFEIDGKLGVGVPF